MCINDIAVISKVKVTWPLNTMTETQPYVLNGKTSNCKLGIWMEYHDLHHRQVTSKVKYQGYNVTSVWCEFAHNSTKKSRGSTKIGRKVVRATGYIAHQFQGQNSKIRVIRQRSGWLFKSPLAGGGGTLWWPSVKLVALEIYVLLFRFPLLCLSFFQLQWMNL